MSFLLSKTLRTALFFVAFSALSLWFSNRERWALAGEWRHAALRELMQDEGAAPEVLFFGSSRTARGILPGIFEQRMQALTGEETSARNLAVMGIHPQVAWLELKSWVRDHPAPKIVCVEVSTSSIAEWPHQLAVRFIDPEDALRLVLEQPFDHRSQRQFGQRRGSEGAFDPGGIFRAMDTNALHLELATQALGRGPQDLVRLGFNGIRSRLDGTGMGIYWAPEPPITRGAMDQQLRDLGWYQISPTSPEGVAGKQKVEAVAARTGKEEALGKTLPFDWSDPKRFRAARLYAELCADWCRDHGARLVFVEMPGFRESRLHPSQLEFFASLGEVFSADRSTLFDPPLYQDDGHLSVDGARWFTGQLARYFAGE